MDVVQLWAKCGQNGSQRTHDWNDAVHVGEKKFAFRLAHVGDLPGVTLCAGV